MIAHCYDGFPEEACGLLAGPLVDDETTGEVHGGVPVRERRALGARLPDRRRETSCARRSTPNRRDEEIVGVWHSHTHTDAYPSPTDVEQAMEAQKLERPWLYPIVSLKYGEPVLRGVLDPRLAPSPRCP